MKNLILQKFALIGFTLIISSCGNQKELERRVKEQRELKRRQNI